MNKEKKTCITARAAGEGDKIKGEASAMISVPMAKVLDAYFVKWKSEQGDPIEIEKTVYDKNTKKNVVKKIKKEREKITLERIDQRGLSYLVALVIETEGLSGKKIKVKVKSGKRKVLTEVDSEIKFIDFKDIEAVTDAKKYKDINPKSEFEIEVGKLQDDKIYSNPNIFKNKAVLRLMLNHKVNDLSFELAELIEEDIQKTAFTYIEVSTSELNVEFCGQGDNKNTFLNEDEKYFKIKYLEQPWVIKARKEQKDKVNETSNCERIKEYHKINRQHKPSKCTGDGNAWCASFVGWCLSKSDYSAQLDAGAFAYSEVKTRYRGGYKKNPSDTKVLEKDDWDDPIWAKKTTNNKIALGSICVKGSHVTFAVAMNKANTYFFGLGGNQGDSVRVSAYKINIKSSVYPIEYIIKSDDYELPIYFRELTSESTR